MNQTQTSLGLHSCSYTATTFNGNGLEEQIPEGHALSKKTCPENPGPLLLVLELLRFAVTRENGSDVTFVELELGDLQFYGQIHITA